MALGALEARSFRASRTSRAACPRWVRCSGGYTIYVSSVRKVGRTAWSGDTTRIISQEVMMTSCIPCVHRYCQHIPLASGLGRPDLDLGTTLEPGTASEAQRSEKKKRLGKPVGFASTTSCHASNLLTS